MARLLGDHGEAEQAEFAVVEQAAPASAVAVAVAAALAPAEFVVRVAMLVAAASVVEFLRKSLRFIVPLRRPLWRICGEAFLLAG